MVMSETGIDMRTMLIDYSQKYPYPIAVGCRWYLDLATEDEWREWECLSREVLQPVLHYLAHLLLSDLVSTGRQPAHLFHRIESILSRPTAGQYLGFLRETARYYREEGLVCGIPELLSFLLSSDVDCTILDDHKPLLGLLVDYRNLWAHGKFDNPAALRETVELIRDLTCRLLEELQFLSDHPLQLADGTLIMGSNPEHLPMGSQPLVVITAGNVPLRPLLLKLKGQDLVLLEDMDLRDRKLGYRGSAGYAKFNKKDLASGDGAKLFEELKALLTKVRSIDAVLPLPDWQTFAERSAVITERTLSLYQEMRKYVPEWYVGRLGWEGDGSIFEKFLGSDKTLLAISGVQGTGKSALVSQLVQEARNQGHAVLFINAQRFSFADVSWAGSPYPSYFAQILHYENPFDQAAFARVVRTAEKGKQIVLFIDAVNEVDGIETKWNRFRAMELLLQWIASVAQPGLKVVVSFRLDAYEEFEYLQTGDEELPPNLVELCWPGTNERKPWVTDLEPFNQEQAEQLYAKLQMQPQYGMAPAMDWEQIVSGLNENLVEFTTNPLLFMIFLRSHHRATRILTSNKDKLFTRYAAKLTGSLELQKRPWWQKVWGFIKNGNITPKEQFLADVVSRMAQEGSAAFLVENLNPKKNKRDLRLKEVLGDAQSQTLKDLQEGGLIVEEKIEIQNAKKQIYSERITFVAELMVITIENVQNRIRKYNKWKSLFITELIVVCGFSMGFWGLFSYAESLFHPRLASLGLIPNTLFNAAHRMFIPIISIAIGYLLILFLMMNIAERKPRSYRASGLLQLSYLEMQESCMIPSLLLSTAPLILPWLVLAFFSAATSTYYSYMAVVGLIIVILELMICMVSPKYWLLLISSSLLNSSPRLIKTAYLSDLKHVTSKEYQRESIRQYMKYVIIGLSTYAFAFMYKTMWLHPDISISQCESYRLYLTMNRISLMTNAGLTGILHIGFMIMGTIAIVIFAPAFSFVTQNKEIRISKYMQSEQNCIRTKKRGIYILTALMQIAAIGAVLGIHLYNWWSYDRYNLKFIKSMGIPSQAVTLENGKIVGLDLTKVTESSQIRSVIGKLRYMTKLTLPDDWQTPVQFSYLSEFDQVTAPIVAINQLSDFHVKELNLNNATGGLTEFSSEGIRKLKIDGGCADLSNLAAKFPGLGELVISEECARSVATGLDGFPPNLRITVESSSEPQLDWLNEGICKYIIALNRPIGLNTKNMFFLRRLHLRGDGLEPTFIGKAKSLRWLLISMSNCQDSDWYRKLRTIVETGLTDLKSLELMTENKPESLISAQSRDEALKMLTMLIEQPGRLGKPKK
jgi:hypothetical protein